MTSWSSNGVKRSRVGSCRWQRLSNYMVAWGSPKILQLWVLWISPIVTSLTRGVTKPVCHWTNVLSINDYCNIVSQSSKNYQQYENTLSLSVRPSWPEGSALPTGPHVCPGKCRIEAKVKCEWRWAEKIQLEIKGRCHDWITPVKQEACSWPTQQGQAVSSIWPVLPCGVVGWDGGGVPHVCLLCWSHRTVCPSQRCYCGLAN